jgi:predicted regulator of Ras-like GTPase activity (Roadblock/LC7/MglB family)
MATLPQLIEEDIRSLDETLRDYLTKTDAMVALIIDKGGFMISHQGNVAELDLTTIGALASGAFMASQTIAGLVNEKDFNHTALQGEKFSLFTIGIDDQCLLVVVFRSMTGLGVVKYYSTATVVRLAQQMIVARDRDPAAGLDLSVMNVADPQDFFRKKTVPARDDLAAEG